MTTFELNTAAPDGAALAARWHQGMEAASFQGKGVDFWDNWVRSLPARGEHSGYVEEVLRRIESRADDAVLDVGAGTGALSLPLARRVRLVTALDHSAAMLENIARQAAAQDITNIEPLRLDWTRARLGSDFVQHDIVLVSRSLPAGKDILRCLDLINRSARRDCYVTWKVDGHDSLETELCRRLGVAYHPFPDADLLYQLIRSLGISPRVDTFTTRGRRVYEGLEQAYMQIVRNGAASAASKQTALEFLADNLKFENGVYLQPKETRWALISWSCC